MVFSLNTLLGLACSLGINLGYNKHHHQVAQNARSSNHQNHHNVSAKPEHCKQKPVSSKDDCCSHTVTSFNLVNKTIPQSVNVSNPVFVTSFVASFFTVPLLQEGGIKSTRHFPQNYHPPIKDIRIAIQSFLI